MLPRAASKRDEDGVLVAIDGHAVAAGAGVVVACAPGYEAVAFAGQLSVFVQVMGGGLAVGDYLPRIIMVIANKRGWSRWGR